MIKVITDSVASIPADMLETEALDVVSLFINRQGVEHVDAEMDIDAFYSEIYDMVDDIPTSSQPSQQTLEGLFTSVAHA
ncbi:MAG: DegV family protein, partial [Eggerthellaceae bacterium]|nr:DegV family protein [Eggerthellaceae bacterium]